jgi:Flp pilus assembly protein TadG
VRTQRCRSQARQQQSGAAAVEFGLLVLPLTLLLLGMIQYGFYFWSMQAGSAAARDAARQLAVSPYCSTIEGYVKDRVGAAAPDWDTDGDGTAVATFANAEGNTDSAAEIGDVVTVTISFKSINLGIPLIPIPDEARVTQSAQARVEYVPETSETCS